MLRSKENNQQKWGKHASVDWTQLRKESTSLKYATKTAQPERQRDKKWGYRISKKFWIITNRVIYAWWEYLERKENVWSNNGWGFSKINDRHITTDPESSDSTTKQHKHSPPPRIKINKTSLRHGIFKLQKSKIKKISWRKPDERDQLLHDRLKSSADLHPSEMVKTVLKTIESLWNWS